MRTKKKYGLTIIELILAIALLGIILALVIPIVNNSLKEQKENLYNVQIANIKNGAKAWTSANAYLLPTNNGDSITITLGELKSKGYVEKNLTNPKTERKFSDNVLVVVTKKNESFLYNVEISDTDEEYADGAPFIVLRGTATEYVEINGTYVEKGVQARDKDGNIISSITTYIKKDGVATDIIRTNQMGTYVITYVATDLSNGKSSSVSRNVVIRDTLAPTIMVNGMNTNHTMIVKKGSNFNIPTAVVVDNSGENITATVKGSVNTNKVGNYEIIYEAKDSNNNVGRLILRAVVKDVGKEIFINYKVNTSLWTNQDVTVTILPVHANTLADQAYSFDGGTTWQASPDKNFDSNQVVRMKARDIEGQESETVNYTITNIDKTLPTCSITGNPTSWVTSATLTINGSDNESGVAGIKKPGANDYSAVTSTTFNVTSNGTYTAYVKDVAGNVNTCSVTVTKIDTDSPTCTITGNPTGWVKNATLTINGSDSQSGLVGIQNPGSSTYTSTTSSTTINVTSNGNYTAYVKDGVGRIGTCSVSVTKVDNVPPTCTSSGGSSSWRNTNVTITGTCSDSISGCTGNASKTYSSNINSSSESPGTVSDLAGNTTVCPANQTVKIDKTPPSCTSSGGSSSWTNSSVTITGTCSDTGGSGCTGNVSKTYSSNINSSSESPGTVSDYAGNTVTCPYNQTVKIDKTAPSCTFGGTGAWATSVVLTVTGSDSDSGIAEVNAGDGYVSGSSAQKTVSAAGSYTAYARDIAGNVGSCTATVSSRKEYRYRDCDTCKRCSGAGCETYNSYTYSGVHRCQNNVTVACNSSNWQSSCETVCRSQTGLGCTTGNNCSRSRTCKTYKRSCSSCGCSSWGSWSSWSTTERSETSSRDVEKRTTYSSG